MTDVAWIRATVFFGAMLAVATLGGGCGGGDAATTPDWDPPKAGIQVSEPARPETADDAERLKYDPARQYEAVVKTTLGPFRLRFFPKETPQTVDNFIQLALSGFYDGTIIHRAVADELIQGGDQEGTGGGNPLFRIRDEFTHRPFDVGIVGMAHTDEPNSANSQWFICLKRMATLDGRYSAFAEVIEGLDVVRAISRLEVEGDRAIAPSRRDRPVRPPVVIEIEVVEAPASR
jgi:peptidyl-prolyl cis-trans isomerase B (cyclophilin B)